MLWLTSSIAVLIGLLLVFAWSTRIYLHAVYVGPTTSRIGVSYTGAHLLFSFATPADPEEWRSYQSTIQHPTSFPEKNQQLSRPVVSYVTHINFDLSTEGRQALTPRTAYEPSRFAGFYFLHQQKPYISFHDVQVELPMLYLLLVAGMCLWFPRFKRLLRKRHVRRCRSHCLCEFCMYDLRESSGFCPECGMVAGGRGRERIGERGRIY